jgi:P27 family predicted phage terminase small subunit
MRARKPIPRKQKLLRGTFRPWREIADIPEHSAKLPTPPKNLDERERHYFNAITEALKELGLASDTFTHMQCLLSQRLAEIDELDAIIRREGSLYVSMPGGAPRRHPAARMRSTAMRHAQSLLAEFGLSPASVGGFV